MAYKQYSEKCDVYGEDGDPVQGKQGVDVSVQTVDDEKRLRGLYIDETFYPEGDIRSVDPDVSGNRVLVGTSSRRLYIRPCSGNFGALHAALLAFDFEE